MYIVELMLFCCMVVCYYSFILWMWNFFEKNKIVIIGIFCYYCGLRVWIIFILERMIWNFEVGLLRNSVGVYWIWIIVIVCLNSGELRDKWFILYLV